MQLEIPCSSLTVCGFLVQNLEADIPVLPPVLEVPDEWTLLVGI